MKRKERQNTITLFKWIWRSYLKIALIPLIVVEMIFVGIYFLANNWSQKETIQFISEAARKELIHTSGQEADTIQKQLQSITSTTDIFRKQMAKALLNPAELSAEDASRLNYSPEGIYYTVRDKKDKGAAVFYSGIMPIESRERQKAARALAMQDLMKDIADLEPLAASVYLNTFDSLNVIYPYFNVLQQYTPHIDIPKFNFYYEADAKHNPERKVQWTDVYLDPAGKGWMTSAIAPVYNNNFLEGVVGIDVTVNTMIFEVLKMEVPWEGYSMLIGRDGTILSLPITGEKDWSLSELTSHHNAAVVLQDTFKPYEFNLFQRKGLVPFAKKLVKDETGFASITLNGKAKEVAWATVQDTGWKLLVVVPKENIYAKANHMRQELLKIGGFMISGLVVFYLVFFCVLVFKAHKMSLNIVYPLADMNTIVKEIGKGNYYQENPKHEVKELQDTAAELVGMGRQLGNANKKLLEMQTELRSREAHLQALINSVDDIIIEFNEEGIFVNIWANSEESLSETFLSGNNTSLDAVLDAQSVKRIKRKIRETIETTHPQTVEYKLQTNRGERWFEGRLSLVPGETKTVVATLRDITEYKKMEELLDS